MLMMETEAHRALHDTQYIFSKQEFPSLFHFRHSFRLGIIPLNQTRIGKLLTL